MRSLAIFVSCLFSFSALADVPPGFRPGPGMNPFSRGPVQPFPGNRMPMGPGFAPGMLPPPGLPGQLGPAPIQPQPIGGAPINWGPQGQLIAPVANPMPIFEDVRIMGEALSGLAADLSELVESNRIDRVRIAQPVWTQVSGPQITPWTGTFVQNMVVPNWYSGYTFPQMPIQLISIEDQDPRQTPDYWVSVHVNTFKISVKTLRDRYMQYRGGAKDAKIWQEVGQAFLDMNRSYQAALSATFFYLEAIKRTYYSGMGVAQVDMGVVEPRLFAIHYRAIGIFELMHLLRARLTPMVPMQFVGAFCFEATMQPYLANWALVQEPLGFIPFPVLPPGFTGEANAQAYGNSLIAPGVPLNLQNFPEVGDEQGWTQAYQSWSERYKSDQDFDGMHVPSVNQLPSQVQQGLQYDLQNQNDLDRTFEPYRNQMQGQRQGMRGPRQGNYRGQQPQTFRQPMQRGQNFQQQQPPQIDYQGQGSQVGSVIEQQQGQSFSQPQAIPTDAGQYQNVTPPSQGEVAPGTYQPGNYSNNNGQNNGGQQRLQDPGVDFRARR